LGAPTAPGVSFIVADPNSQAIVSKSTPQSAAGSLQRGVALALGPIQTSTAAKNIAAVAGYGTAVSCGGCAVLAVIDMTDPTKPQPLGFAGLSDVPTDVVLKGNTAIVGYSTNTSELFDLTNPVSPVTLGMIQGVGGRLFVYNSMLFSTGAVPGVPASPLGGVHIAQLDTPPVAVKSVSFTGTNCPQVTPPGESGPGAGCINIFNDTVGAANLIKNPVWLASNVDSANLPVAYVQGQTISLTATLASSQVPTIPINNVTITGQVAGLGNCTATGQTIPVQPTFTVSCTMDAALPANKTKFYNPLVINWSYTIGTDTTFIGITKNQVYVTLAQPLQDKVYRTTLNLAIAKDKATDRPSAFQNTWSQFSIDGTGPANLQTWYGQPLFYYRNDSHPVGFASVACPLSPLDEGILLEAANSSGQCTTFAVLFMEALRVNGIDSHEIRIKGADGTGFLVKDWSFSPSPFFSTEPLFKWKLVANQQATDNRDLMIPAQVNGVYGDLTSLGTVPGQNSVPPSEKAFSSHFIVMVLPPASGQLPAVDPSADQYFDPSYGLTYKNADNFEVKAVDGYWAQFPSDASNVFRVRKPIANSPNISFCDLNGPGGPSVCFP